MPFLPPFARGAPLSPEAPKRTYHLPSSYSLGLTHPPSLADSAAHFSRVQPTM